MVSSTFTDLKDHRNKAIEAIQSFGYKANVMEHDGPRVDVDVIDSSLKMVRDSVAYILIISRKYGQTPVCPKRNPDQLSITELEFDEAMRLNRPILLFIMAKKHPIIEEDIELDSDKRQKLDAFRERAKRMRADSGANRVYKEFDTLERFSTDAAIAIGRLVQDLDSRNLSPQLTNNAANAVFAGTHSNIPINMPRHFLGRDEDLASIDAELKRNHDRVAITALHGLRGVGKTTLAAAYAERHRGDYHATWWIRAQTEPTMRADLVALAVRLGWVAEDAAEEPALAAVFKGLRDEREGILLVYDNANNPDEIRKYLPRGGTTQIIVTSNAPNWGGVAAPMEIEVWPNEVGADYLILRSGRDGKRHTALALSGALGGLPLAHEQAAAYCERLGISFADYLKRFEVTPAKLLDAEKDAPAEYHDQMTVAKTFALAVDEATKLHPAAEPLIFHAALLAPEPIPLFLFAEAREKFCEPLASSLADDGLDEAVAALLAFALVDREIIPDERDPSITTDCIRLHRLVRQISAVRRENESLDAARAALIEALVAVYPGDVFDDPETWPRARRLDAIILALVDNDSALPNGTELSAATLLSRLDAYRHVALAAYTEAQRLSQRALAIRERVLGPDHPSTAVSLNNIGDLLRSQADLAGARSYYERALAINEKTLGTANRETATNLNNIGVALRQQGDFAAARSYYERALAIDEKVLGLNHPDTATDVNNLGELLLAEGDLVGAQSYLERALAIWEEARGLDHPDTAISLHNLGVLLWSQDDFPKAQSYVERALAIYEKVLGPEHPSTRNCAKSAARILQARGKLEEAAAMREKYDVTD